MLGNTNKPVVFLAFANDRSGTVGQPLNLPEEERQVREKLEAAESLCEFVARSNCTADDIFKVLQDAKYRDRIAIFHYSGHANSFQLLLETRDGNATTADASGLASFLAAQRGLQLVFLNGCSTQQQAQGLLNANKNIAAVIATSRAIDDQVGTNFSARFYAALAQGTNLSTAFNEANAAITTTKGSNHRKLYYDNANSLPGDNRNSDGSPWKLYTRPGSEIADQWNLRDAANDPLFGLPPLPKLNLPKSPYKHLNWFTREDAYVFFGRGHQIRRMYDALTVGEQPIILFYGQSGVGKSSLLDAGLLPRLEQNYEVRYARRGANGLLETLRSTLMPEATGTPIETAWLAKEKQPNKPLIVFLDQVEEFYTRPIESLPNELDELLQVLKAIFGDPNRRPQGKLVLSFREEWLARLKDRVEFYNLPYAPADLLKPLDRDGIIEVVQGPTRTKRLLERYNLSVELGLAGEIADDLLADRDSAIATTLQILLSKMWEHATESNSEPPRFTRDMYLDLKAKGILLGDFLDQQLQAFEDGLPGPAKSGLLLDILAQHTTNLGTADQSSEADLLKQYSHMSDVLPDLLKHCEDLYLLTTISSNLKDAPKTRRLAHDTLAPLVRAEFDKSDKPGQRARRILDNRSVDWKGDKAGSPLDAADLKLVERGRDGTRALNATEQRLLEASQRARDNANWWRNVSIGVGAALIVAIIGLAIFGWLNYRNAKIANEDLIIKTVEAKNNLSVAEHSVNYLLGLYTEPLRRAAEVAAATTAREARLAYDRWVASIRMKESENAVEEIDAYITEWEEYSENLDERDDNHPARKCRRKVLKLVSVTKHDLDNLTTEYKPLAEMIQKEVAKEGHALCSRATNVTRGIAHAAPDTSKMLAFRSEFERLYWAELYWVELDQKKRRPDGSSPLESAMVRFRRDGINEWELDKTEIARTELDTLAREVHKCCDELLSRPTPVIDPGK